MKRTRLITAFATLLTGGLVILLQPWRQSAPNDQTMNPPARTPHPHSGALPSLRASNPSYSPSPDGDRVAAARKRAGKSIAELFKNAGVSWPPHRIHLRAFKREGHLEMWAGADSGPMTLVATWQVAAHSGGPGPKRREGDMQVPEGFYEVDRFNPQSSFHLSLGINYPNAADRILADPQRPGCDIFIHGGAASAGCLAMGDDSIEEIYLAALESRVRPIPVHIFPARMDTPDWPDWRAGILAAKPGLATLWEQLAEAARLFEKSRIPPAVSVAPDGAYIVAPGE